MKTLFVKASDEIDAPIVALIIRGDHELNEIKAEKLTEVASPLEMASEEEIRALIGAGPGSLGPVGLKLPFIVDRTVAVMNDFGAARTSMVNTTSVSTGVVMLNWVKSRSA